MLSTLVKVGPDTLNKVLAYTSHVFPTCCLFDFLIIAPLLLGILHTTRIHNVCEGTGFPVLLLVYHIIIRKTSRLLTIFSVFHQPQSDQCQWIHINRDTQGQKRSLKSGPFWTQCKNPLWSFWHSTFNRTTKLLFVNQFQQIQTLNLESANKSIYKKSCVADSN